METVSDPDTYEPSLNKDGVYVDTLSFAWPSKVFVATAGHAENTLTAVAASSWHTPKPKATEPGSSI